MTQSVHRIGQCRGLPQVTRIMKNGEHPCQNAKGSRANWSAGVARRLAMPLLCLLWFSAHVSAQQRISGIVVEKGSSKGLADATVTLEGNLLATPRTVV